MTEREAPGADEFYECATNTSDLSVPPSYLPAGAPDALMAAAWGARSIGAGLVRLSAQWAAEKPQHMEPPPSVRQLLAAGYEPEEAQKQHEAELLRCARAYAWETAALVRRLRDLPAVRDHLTEQATRWGMGEPQEPAQRLELAAQRAADVRRLLAALQAVRATQGASYAAVLALSRALLELRERQAAEACAQYARAAPIAAAVVRFWLDQTCRSCEGRGRRVVAGTPMLSAKVCSACQGSGKARVPFGAEGRRLAAYLDQCQHRAMQSMQNRLRGRSRAAPQRDREESVA